MKAAFTHPLPSFLFIKTLREENILSENINTTDGRGFIKLIIKRETKEMAWNHNARNRSAEVRRVNYHEDGPDRTNKNNNRHSNNQ